MAGRWRFGAAGSRVRDSGLAAAPLDCRVYIRSTIAAAVVGCVAAYAVEGIGGRRDAAAAVVLIAASVFTVEVARCLEGRQRVAQRPHKALSAWASCSAAAGRPG